MNPIHKALSTIQRHRVRYLLMGGQACILYGGAKFSRDLDLCILSDLANLVNLRGALNELQAEQIAVPPFEESFLHRGHAIQFRARHPEAAGLRIDIMSRMRGLGSFDELWNRRTTLELESGNTVEVLSLPDLVQAKKTQRDKDWPMIRRLLEADYLSVLGTPTEDRVLFWLNEMRTPSLLTEITHRYPEAYEKAREFRPLLASAHSGDTEAVEAALYEEERMERTKDREYWLPLREELEMLRHPRRI